jgi:general secretion pathway protein G
MGTIESITSVALRRTHGFTLIEVLIVVVIMAVLAAVVIPQVSGSAEEAKRAALGHNLQVLRNQLTQYMLNHNGTPPAIAGGTLPQLLNKTNVLGDIGATDEHKFGPYVQGGQFPVNPLDGKNTVSATSVFPPTGATAAGGWLYHAATGRIAANHTDF